MDSTHSWFREMHNLSLYSRCSIGFWRAYVWKVDDVVHHPPHHFTFLRCSHGENLAYSRPFSHRTDPRLQPAAFQVKYLNKHMHMYTKYDLPIWLTEFACGFEATELSADGQVRSRTPELALSCPNLVPSGDSVRDRWLIGLVFPTV